jgi:DNA-binding PucR family transcriptional regulator
LKVQGIAGDGDGATSFDDLGVYRILAGVEDTGGIDRFVQEWLGELLDYDALRGGELVLTLSRYLDNGRHHETTARALNVHRSTLKYRLQRIREISGHDLAEPDTAFNLQLATRSWQTLQALNMTD